SQAQKPRVGVGVVARSPAPSARWERWSSTALARAGAVAAQGAAAARAVAAARPAGAAARSEGLGRGCRSPRSPLRGGRPARAAMAQTGRLAAPSVWEPLVEPLRDRQAPGPAARAVLGVRAAMAAREAAGVAATRSASRTCPHLRQARR